MFADGLFDTFRPLLLLLTIVATVDMVAHAGDPHSTGTESRPTDRGSRMIESPSDALMLIFSFVYWMLLSGGWLLALGTATIGGIVAALVTWDLWPLGIVFVAGSLLGWLASLVFYAFGEPLWVRRSDGMGDLMVSGVGVAVAIIITIIVALAW